MSEYNSYATQLDSAFKDAKQKTDNALAAFREAERAVKADNDQIMTTQERFQGDLKFRLAQHEAEYQLARENMNKVLREAWAEFYRTRDSLTTALEKVVGQSQAVNADQVDLNGVILLNSNILNSYDLQALADKYAGNATMTRLVGNKAKELADATKDKNADEHIACLMISRNCENTAESSNVMKRWEMLTRSSDIYSNKKDQTDPAYVSQISDHWNDDNIQNAVKDF